MVPSPTNRSSPCYNQHMLIGIDASRAAIRHRTGTETYSVNVIRELLRLGQQHQFRLYTNVELPAGLLWSGTVPAHVEVRSIPFRRLWTHARLSLETLVSQPNVLFVPAHVLPLLHPQRSVVTVHDLGYLHYPDAHTAGARRYLDWSTRWNAHQATAVLADSEATRADLVRFYGAETERIRVVYLGRDAGLKQVSDPLCLAKVRARYGLARRYLLYVGTLQPRKNLERIVHAFERICDRPALAELQLVLAGKQGWLYDTLYSQVARAGLQGRVIFPGYVADEDLGALLSGATAFVFPSLYEGFGIPVLEAGGCGVPVITSNTSSLPEVAGDAALLVDPLDVDAIADAMYRLVTDEALRVELARRGLENVKRFSWDKCARETLAVLESVAKK